MPHEIVRALYESGLMDCAECKGRKVMEYADYVLPRADLSKPMMEQPADGIIGRRVTEPCRSCGGTGRLTKRAQRSLQSR